MDLRNVLGIILVLIPLCGCERTVEDPSEFIRLCNSEKEGLVLSYPERGTVFSLRYRPTEFFAAQAVKEAQPGDRSGAASRVAAEYSGNFYFLYSVRIDRKNGSSAAIAQDLEVAQRAIEKTQLSLPARIVLVGKDNDTLRCELAQYQPDWTGRSGFDILLAFKKTKSSGQIADLEKMILREVGGQAGYVEFKLESMRSKYRFAYRKEGENV
jgi:hypothetical protein